MPDNGDVVVLDQPPEKKSQLFDIFFRNLSYPLASAIVRGIKVGLGIIIPALVAALGDGTLISSFHFLPPASAAVISMMVAPVAIAIEVYLRKNGLIDEQTQNPISVAGGGPPTEVDIPDNNRPLSN